MITMQQIREQYPNPIEAHNALEDTEYCIGGAVCLSKGKSEPFPTPVRLAQELIDIVFVKTHKASNTGQVATNAFNALCAARGIIEANDNGEFNRAWEILDTFLTHNS